MLNAKRFYWLAQFVGWVSYCALLTLSVYTNNPEKINSIFLLNVGILIVSGILATHVQRLMFIKLGWLEFRLPKLLPRLIASSFFFSIIIAGIDYTTDYYTNLNNLKSKPVEFSDIIVSIFAVSILVLFWNAIYFTFHFFQKSRNQEISNLELAASKRESELKNLRSQLNPHFLFNSLNSIRALVDIDPSKAKESITTLSNLLRQSLLLGRENTVSLENELNLAKSYLDLEKIRFEERLKVIWEMEPGLDQFQIPPFSLQMMIENAIKHGISELKEGGLVIVRAYKLENGVCIEVENSGSLKSVVDLGVGIQNVKQRLSLQYGGLANFEIEEKNGVVIAKMIFIHERI